MKFQEASDRAIGACITLADIAEAAGTAPQTLRRARIDPGSSNYRRPPDGWERAIARLARERAAELRKLAEQLEVARRPR